MARKTFGFKGIKLVIFDLDGTLVDAYPAIISSFNYTMQKLNYPKQGNLAIRRAVGWGDENLLRPFIDEKDLPVALSVYRGHHKSALVIRSRLFPGAKKLLAYLRNKGYILAVASNRPTAFSGILIRHLELKKYFSYVLCADRLKHIKPHPEIINQIIKKFALKRNETLYAGDMAIDAQAGRRAKVKTAIVTTGSSSKAEIEREKPFLIISRIFDLSKFL